MATTSLLLRRVHNHFRSGLARFKLRAHFLDLRGLLFELGRESLYLFLLLLAQLRDLGILELAFSEQHANKPTGFEYPESQICDDASSTKLKRNVALSKALFSLWLPCA